MGKPPERQPRSLQKEPGTRMASEEVIPRGADPGFREKQASGEMRCSEGGFAHVEDFREDPPLEVGLDEAVSRGGSGDVVGREGPRLALGDERAVAQVVGHHDGGVQGGEILRAGGWVGAGECRLWWKKHALRCRRLAASGSAAVHRGSCDAESERDAAPARTEEQRREGQGGTRAVGAWVKGGVHGRVHATHQRGDGLLVEAHFGVEDRRPFVRDAVPVAGLRGEDTGRQRAPEGAASAGTEGSRLAQASERIACACGTRKQAQAQAQA